MARWRRMLNFYLRSFLILFCHWMMIQPSPNHLFSNHAFYIYWSLWVDLYLFLRGCGLQWKWLYLWNKTKCLLVDAITSNNGKEQNNRLMILSDFHTPNLEMLSHLQNPWSVCHYVISNWTILYNMYWKYVVHNICLAFDKLLAHVTRARVK